MMKLLALALMIGAASAACPNACSGHGTCNGSGLCTCYLEGKALYVNAQADPTAGWQRGDGGGESVTRTQDYRRAIFAIGTTPTDATTDGTGGIQAIDTAVYIDTGAAGANAKGMKIMDGGAGYMYGASAAVSCSYDDTYANYVAAGCPLIGMTTNAGGTAAQNSAAECTATVTDGAITRVRCGNAAAAGFSDATTATWTVAAPSYDAMDRQIPQAQWTGADCSLMTCPRGMSRVKHDAATPWFTDLASTSWFRSHVDNVECSDAGMCDRSSGECKCFPGFTGSACQRTECPNECSGHGICQSNLMFAEEAGARYYGAWDSGLQFGCLCDSGFRGNDCSLQECPSDADPNSYQGNTEGRDCSGRGLCDYSSGECNCFAGYTGNDCGDTQVLA